MGSLFLLKFRWSCRNGGLNSLLLLLGFVRNADIFNLGGGSLGGFNVLRRSRLYLGLLGDLFLRSFFRLLLGFLHSLGSSCSSLFIRHITGDLGFHVALVVASSFSLAQLSLLGFLTLLSELGLRLGSRFYFSKGWGRSLGF